MYALSAKSVIFSQKNRNSNLEKDTDLELQANRKSTFPRVPWNATESNILLGSLIVLFFFFVWCSNLGKRGNSIQSPRAREWTRWTHLWSLWSQKRLRWKAFIYKMRGVGCRREGGGGHKCTPSSKLVPRWIFLIYDFLKNQRKNRSSLARFFADLLCYT